MANNLLATLTPNSLTDLLSYAAILALVFLIGIDVAFSRAAYLIFSQNNQKLWRFFFLGKITLNAYTVTNLALRIDDGTIVWWQGPFVLLGSLTTITTLLLIWGSSHPDPDAKRNRPTSAR